MCSSDLKADELHDSGLKALFKQHGEGQAMAFLIGREVYRHLERVLDAFEDVADEIQGIVIDHARWTGSSPSACWSL